MDLAEFVLNDALPARFWAKVVQESSGCWRWTGGLNRNGYGRTTRTGERSMAMAHRVAYEALVGPIPDGLVLDHLCRVRCCVRPDHLEPVTQRENLLRGETTVARAIRQTHCPSGHPYAGANLYVNPKGERQCRECHRTTEAKRRAADPEAAHAARRRHDAAYRARKRERLSASTTPTLTPPGGSDGPV